MPIHSSLRLQGHTLAYYIDDNHNYKGDNYQEFLNAVLETVKLVTEFIYNYVQRHPRKLFSLAMSRNSLP